MNKDCKNIIYGLSDPRNDLVYYVGKTTIGKKRPLTHLIKSHSDKVNEWVNELQLEWVTPVILVLEEVDDLNELGRAEIKHIEKWARLNSNLLNVQGASGLDFDKYTLLDEKEFNAMKVIIPKMGEIFRKRRLACNITQDELSKEAGLSRSTISLMERGKKINLRSVNELVRVMEGIRIARAGTLKLRARKPNK